MTRQIGQRKLACKIRMGAQKREFVGINSTIHDGRHGIGKGCRVIEVFGDTAFIKLMGNPR